MALTFQLEARYTRFLLVHVMCTVLQSKTSISWQVFASVRATNAARLTSQSVSASVYISPNTNMFVLDGNADEDINFQNDLSTLSGQVTTFYYTDFQR